MVTAKDETSPDGGDKVNGEADLDEVLNLESNYHAQGVADSQEGSARAGRSDGRELGWATGRELVSELSFYRGCADALLSLDAQHGGKLSARALQSATALKAHTDGLRLHEVGNDSNVDMESQAETARTLFKAMAAQSGLLVRYDKRPSKLSDLSF